MAVSSSRGSFWQFAPETLVRPCKHRAAVRVAKHTDPLEVQRFNLAERMVRLEARTHTIRRWTGLSEGRVRALYRLHVRDRGGARPVRHRGPPPHLVSFFLKTAQLRAEAAALAVLCSTLEVLPERRLANVRRELPGVQRGEALCRAYELYCALTGGTELTLEHAVLLVTAIAQGNELSLEHCAECGGALVYGPADLSRRICLACRVEEQWIRQLPHDRESEAPERGTLTVQQSLF